MLSHHRIYSCDPLFVCLSGLNWSCHGVRGKHPWPHIPFNADPSFLSQSSSIVLWRVSPGIFTRETIIVYVFLAVWWWHPHHGGRRTSLLSLHWEGCFIRLPLHACVRMFYPAVHCFLSLVFDSPIKPRLNNSLSHLFQCYCGIGYICVPLLLHLAVCWLLHIWFLVLLSRVLVIWRMCVSTHSRLDMASSDLLCNLDISFRISHDFTRSGHIFSHHPSPPYLVFQVQHILLSPYAFTSVDPGQYLCLSIPLSSFTYFPQCAYPFTVIISECYACMCISIHSLWCGGLFRVTQTLV